MIVRTQNANCFREILNTCFFPSELAISIDYENDALVLKINDWQSFIIKKNWIFNTVYISIKFKESARFHASDFRSAFKQLIKNCSRLHASYSDNEWTISIDSCSMGEVQETFFRLYNVTIPLRDFNYQQFLLYHYESGFLMTHFNKYLCLDGLRLRQTSDSNFSRSITAFLLEDSIVLKLKDQDIFLASFTNQGYVKFSNVPRFFECADTKSPSIKYGDMFLSARAGSEGLFSLMPHCREWERFKFFPKPF